MTIERSKHVRAQAIASIESYFVARMDEQIGNMAAGARLAFFVQEIGPSPYHKPVADARDRLQQRALALDIEVHEDEFAYWHKRQNSAQPRRKFARAPRPATKSK